MTYHPNLTSCVLVALMISLSGCSQHVEGERTISVVGMVSILVPPDHLVAHLSVETVHADSAEAKKANDDKVQSVLALLSELEVPVADIATGYVSLRERYKRGREGEQVFEGFEAATSIRATVRDLSLYDRFIEDSLSLGLNRIWGVTFKTTEIVDKHREARKLAISAAREKAKYLAAELGQAVGPALSITELRSGSTPRWAGSPISNVEVVEPGHGEFSPDILTQTIVPESIRVQESVQVVFRLESHS